MGESKSYAYTMQHSMLELNSSSRRRPGASDRTSSGSVRGGDPAGALDLWGMLGFTLTPVQAWSG